MNGGTGSTKNRLLSRRWLLAGGLVLVLMIGVLGIGAALMLQRTSGGPAQTNVQRPAPPLAISEDPERGDVRFIDSGQIVAGPSAEVEITPPAGASEMQVGLDPTFATVEWVPVANRATVPLPDVGYQMLFARFRSGDGPPSEVSVDALTVDPTYEAATASVDGLHRASWVRPLAPTALVVRVEAGRVARGAQEVYDFDAPLDGDDISGFPSSLFGLPEVSRGGEPYGRQVTGEGSLIRVYDTLVGRPLDGEALEQGPWSMVSPDDPNFSAETAIPSPMRVTLASNNGLGADGERFTPVTHDLYLDLPSPLVPGARYVLTPPPDLVEPVEFTIDPAFTVSPSVHVNQNGYRPSDAVKVGYLSGPINGVGSEGYGADMAFDIIDVESGDVAYSGQTVGRPGGDELGQGDLTGTPVFELDFSSFAAPGRYRACVEGVGCSEDFSMADEVWDELSIAVARAMYHQRSGVALGPPYTSVARPRPYHPDDGMVVVESSYRLLEASNASLEQLFIDLVEGGSDVPVPEAWGGHFDAGDWDRRIQHLYYVRAVAELVELDPQRYEAMNLGIPESDNAIPDLLDEGLWTLDLFRRLQRDDGAVSGGIEASEHPLSDTTSWSDPLAVFAFAPDPWTSYFYAGVAAQTADVLRTYDPAEAEDYLASAEAAMAWAEAQPEEPAYAEAVRLERSLAAVSLYKATGDDRWHQIFKETTTLGDGVDAFLACNEHGRCDAGWIYLSIDEGSTDPDLRAMVEQSFIANADEIVAAAEETAFGWTLENRFVPLIWGLGVGGAPNAVGLLRAYELTGDERYLGAAQRSAAVSLGANPTNTVFITGVGRTPVRNPLIVDTLNGGLPVWSGTPVYGLHQLNSFGDEGWIEEFIFEPAGVDPLPTQAPFMWQWHDVPDVPMFNEYTVFQSHGQALYVFGLLAKADSSGS